MELLRFEKGDYQAAREDFDGALSLAQEAVTVSEASGDQVGIAGKIADTFNEIVAALSRQTPDRLLNVGQAFREGFTLE